MNPEDVLLKGKTPLSPVVRNINREIPGIDLTLYEQIDVCAFPSDAIEYAAQATKIALSHKEHFYHIWPYFFKICLNYCEMHNIQPDWNRVYQLRNYYYCYLENELTNEESLVDRHLNKYPELKNPSPKVFKQQVIKTESPVVVLSPKKPQERKDFIASSPFFRFLSPEAKKAALEG